ncbi:hypothetical protein SteCoe_30151 [Stentor coeruleus]|uniref:Uncharacterized protein n=1 Tax=Stentor coeruleus TaxID=5963 RepID=A0A1R2B479_9CILI|nr:hypothetical protein SteCoe_30151 [Stentor coeruleus]
MGSLCTTCDAEKENEVHIIKGIYVPESLKPQGFPLSNSASDSESEEVLATLVLPSPSEHASIRRCTYSDFKPDEDHWTISTLENSPFCKSENLSPPCYT